MERLIELLSKSDRTIGTLVGIEFMFLRQVCFRVSSIGSVFLGADYKDDGFVVRHSVLLRL